MLENFVKVADMPVEVIEKYRNQVPEELVQIWEEDGLGTFLDGYFKVINPDDYIDFVKETYFDGDIVIPIFLTALGDIVTWEKNTFVTALEYKSENIQVLIAGFDHFIKFYNHEIILEELDMALFDKAVKRLGPLEYDECFGFVPILPLGGKKDVDHMDKVKIREHLVLLVQFTGGLKD